MWQQIINWVRLLWDTGKEFQQMRTELKDLQNDQRATYEFMQALANQNELLRQELRHERELRERDLKELKLEIRLQIAEGLRRLPPTK